MERILCLVLDEDAKIKLPLFEGTSDEIDEYTTKFDNADTLRKKYKDEIASFLEQHQDFFDARDPEKKKYYGRIVVLEKHNGYYEQKRVLFKKHLIAFKNFIYKDKLTMQEFARLERVGYVEYNKKRLLSSFVLRKISLDGTYAYKTKVEEIKRDINNDSDFYDILRIIIKAYKHQRELRPHLPTIERIYSEYVEAKKAKKKEKDALKRETKAKTAPVSVTPDKQNNQDEDIKFVINGVRYNADELHLFDLDDIDIESSNMIPDGKGVNDKTRK